MDFGWTTLLLFFCTSCISSEGAGIKFTSTEIHGFENLTALPSEAISIDKFLECSAEIHNNISVDITWFKDGKRINLVDGWYSVRNNTMRWNPMSRDDTLSGYTRSRLTFEGVRRISNNDSNRNQFLQLADRGSYQCEFGNVTSDSMAIAFKFPPMILNITQHHTNISGVQVLMCEVESFPTPNITWRFLGAGPLNNGKFFNLMFAGESYQNLLTVNSSGNNASVVYECIAENDLGRVSMSYGLPRHEKQPNEQVKFQPITAEVDFEVQPEAGSSNAMDVVPLRLDIIIPVISAIFVALMIMIIWCHLRRNRVLPAENNSAVEMLAHQDACFKTM